MSLKKVPGWKELKKAVNRGLEGMRLRDKSIVAEAWFTLFDRIKHRFFVKKSPNYTHFTFKKIGFAMLGFIPIGCAAHYLGYMRANKRDFNQVITPFESQDQIFSLVDSGRPVLTFLSLPGESFSEFATPELHKAAFEHNQ